MEYAITVKFRRGSDDPAVTTASSLPSLHSQQQLQSLPSNDSDPDYNLTLTADNFSGMRQAIQTSMEVDDCHVVVTTAEQQYHNGGGGACANSIANGCTQPSGQQQQRPFFFLEPTTTAPAQLQPRAQSISNGAHTVGKDLL